MPRVPARMKRKVIFGENIEAAPRNSHFHLMETGDLFAARRRSRKTGQVDPNKALLGFKWKGRYFVTHQGPNGFIRFQSLDAPEEVPLEDLHITHTIELPRRKSDKI